VTEVKESLPEVNLADGVDWPEQVLVAFSDIDSGVNMPKNKDYASIAYLAGDYAGDRSFTILRDKVQGETTLKSDFESNTVVHPDEFESSRIVGWRYLKGIRKWYTLRSIPKVEGSAVKTPMVRKNPTFVSPGQDLTTACTRLMTVSIADSFFGRSALFPLDYSTGSGMYTGNSTNVELGYLNAGYWDAASAQSYLTELNYPETTDGTERSNILTSLVFRQGGLLKITATFSGTHHAGEDQVMLQGGLRLFSHHPYQTGSEYPAYINVARTHTDVSMPASGRLAPVAGTPAKNFKLSCSLVVDTSVLAGPTESDFKDMKTLGFINVGILAITTPGAFEYTVPAQPSSWKFITPWTGVASEVSMGVRVTVDYIPPGVSLMLSGDVEPNPGPFIVEVSDGVITTLRHTDDTRAFLRASMLRTVPRSVIDSLESTLVYGPEEVDWEPDDINIHKSAVERKVVPTGGERKPLVAKVESKIVRTPAEAINERFDRQGPSDNLGGWEVLPEATRPIGIVEKTATTSVHHVIQRVCSRLKHDDDFVKWLITRRPKISWAATIHTAANLGGVATLAFDLYRAQIHKALWPLAWAVKHQNPGCTVACVLFAMCKSGQTWNECWAGLHDGLSNLERMNNAPKGIAEWKTWLRDDWNTKAKKLARDNLAVELPPLLALVCVEPNPGPMILGFPAHKHPNQQLPKDFGLLRGGSETKTNVELSDIVSLTKLKPSAVGVLWDAESVRATFSSVEIPAGSSSTPLGDLIAVRTTSTSGGTSLARIMPPEIAAQCIYNTEVETTHNLHFAKVGLLTEEKYAGRWTTTAGANDFVAQMLGPVAARADRAIRNGFRMSDIALWLNTVTTNRAGVATLNAGALPSTSYYANFLRVVLPMIPKLVKDKRFPMAGYLSGSSSTAANVIGDVELSYNDGRVAKGEVIDDFKYPILSETTFANNLSFWTSASQAYRTAAGTVLPVPAQLLAAAANNGQMNKFVALFCRMWSVCPMEFAVLSNGAGTGLSKGIAFSSMIGIDGGLDRLKLVIPLVESAPIPDTPGEARGQTNFVPRLPDDTELPYSVGVPDETALVAYCGQWLVQTSVEEIQMFLSLMADILSAKGDLDAAIFDGCAISMPVPYYCLGEFPNTLQARAYFTHTLCTGVRPTNVIGDDAPYYPLDIATIKPVLWGRQGSPTVYALQVFGLISDTRADYTGVSNFCSTSQMAAHLRYPSRCVSTVFQALFYLTDISQTIWVNALTTSYLNGIMTILRNTLGDGSGRVKWPILERMFSIIWGSQPPRDKTGMCIFDRATYEPTNELGTPLSDAVGASFADCLPVMLPDSVFHVASKLGSVFEPFIPSMNVEAARLPKGPRARTMPQMLWLAAATERMIAPTENDSSSPFILPDETLAVTPYERKVSRLCANFNYSMGAITDVPQVPTATVANNLYLTATAAQMFKALKFYSLPYMPASVSNGWASKSTFTIPALVYAGNKLMRVFWALKDAYVTLPTLTGEVPYAVDTMAATTMTLGNRLGLTPVGINVKKLAMDQDSASSAAAEPPAGDKPPNV
jgi:hypothetical protein